MMLLPWLCIYVLLQNYRGRRRLSEDTELVQKRNFESANSYLSNATKHILLDSLLQEVTAEEIQIAGLSLKLWGPETLF